MSLLMLLTGCFGITLGAGPTYGMAEDDPNATLLEMNIEYVAGPRSSIGSSRMRMVDDAAACHYGASVGSRLTLGDGFDHIGLTGAGMFHCHNVVRNDKGQRRPGAFGFEASAGLQVGSLGGEGGRFAMNVVSPYVQLGPRIYVGNGDWPFWLKPQAIAGYDLALAGSSRLWAGGTLSLTFGLLP